MSRSSVVALIAFGFLSVAVVLGVLVFGVDESSTPFITSVLGMLGLAITQLMTNRETQETKETAAETKETVTELNKDLRNGTFERLVREALHNIANDPETKLEITQERRTDDG